MRILSNRYVKIPLTQLTTPSDGTMVIKDRYWLVTENDEALFYKMGKSLSPQCNPDIRICEKYRIQGTSVKFIPLAFIQK